MKKYISAEMQIIKMSANDIIATSNVPNALSDDFYGEDPTLVQGRRSIWE